MNSIKDLLDECKLKVRKLEAITAYQKQQLQDIIDQITVVNGELEPTKEAILLARKCLEESIQLKTYIEDIISEGLTEVLGVKYRWVLETILDDDTSIKGLQPKIAAEGCDLDDPLEAEGAGAVTIVSLLFRIAVLILTNQTAKVLIGDEILANLNPVLQGRLRIFIDRICKEAGLQLIMVTHLDEPFGKVYKIVKKNGISSAIEVTDE